MARVPKMARFVHFCPNYFLFLFPRLASLYREENVNVYTYMTVYSLYINYRCYQIILRVTLFYTNQDRCEVLTRYLSFGAGLPVTGRIRDILQNVLQSSFGTGRSSCHSYYQIVFFIAFRDCLYNIIIICNNNNAVINNNFGKTPNPYFAVQNSYGHAKDFRACALGNFASPDVG